MTADDEQLLHQRRASLGDLGDALRELLDVVTGTRAPTTVLDRVSAQMKELSASLQPYRCEIDGVGDHENYMAAAEAHVLNPEFEILEKTNDHLRARARFGLFFRNGFGTVNGGAVALLFDHVVAGMGSPNGVLVYTANLSVDFRRGVPIDVDLSVVCTRTGSDGRKHTVAAQLLDGEIVLAEATALLIDERSS